MQKEGSCTLKVCTFNHTKQTLDNSTITSLISHTHYSYLYLTDHIQYLDYHSPFPPLHLGKTAGCHFSRFFKVVLDCIICQYVGLENLPEGSFNNFR